MKTALIILVLSTASFAQAVGDGTFCSHLRHLEVTVCRTELGDSTTYTKITEDSIETISGAEYKAEFELDKRAADMPAPTPTIDLKFILNAPVVLPKGPTGPTKKPCNVVFHFKPCRYSAVKPAPIG